MKTKPRKAKHIERMKDRHGKLRLYYRVYPGPRIPLRGPEGSAEFWEDYAAASGAIGAKKSGKADPKSLDWLVNWYYSTSEFKTLNPRTQRVRRGVLKNFCDMEGKIGIRYGDRYFAQLEPRHLRTMRDNMTDRPEAANSIIKGLRQVYKVAKDRDMVATNPAADVPMLKPKNKTGHHSWTMEEVEKFERTHPIGTKARLALALFLYTSQRRGDVVRMGRQHVRDEWLHVIQEKAGAELHIPILRDLRAVIDASPTGDLTFIVTEFGKPFTSNGFGNRMRKWCDEAGLPNCSAHGLRKASAVRMAEAGCTDLEIMSYGGWETLAEVQRYTKGARQRTMAAAARDKMDR